MLPGAVMLCRELVAATTALGTKIVEVIVPELHVIPANMLAVVSRLLSMPKLVNVAMEYG